MRWVALTPSGQNFNAAIRSVICEPENKREPFQRIAASCLGDLERNYKEACEAGDRLKGRIAASYLFARLDNLYDKGT
jgi:hypothetical protein